MYNFLKSPMPVYLMSTGLYQIKQRYWKKWDILFPYQREQNSVLKTMTDNLVCIGKIHKTSIPLTHLAVNKPLHCEFWLKCKCRACHHRWQINAQPIAALANMTDGINQVKYLDGCSPVMLRPGIDHAESGLVNLLHTQFHFLSETFIPRLGKLNSKTCIKSA